MAWTTDDLTTSVRRWASLPSSTADDRFTDADLCELATEEMQTRIVPEIRDARQDYWVTSTDVSIVSGTRTYRIPSRAATGSLRDVTILDDSGTGSWSLPMIPVEDVWRFDNDNGSLSGCVFTIEGDLISILPTPGESGTMRLKYVRRMPKLVPTASAFSITSVVSSTLNGNVPSTWTTSNTFDIIEGTPNFDALGVDLSADTVTASDSIDLSAAPPSETAAGDYVALAGESPIIPLPTEFHDVLNRFTAAAVCEAIGDAQACQMHFGRAAMGLAAALQLIQPRVLGETKRVINRDGILRRNRWFW